MGSPIKELNINVSQKNTINILHSREEVVKRIESFFNKKLKEVSRNIFEIRILSWFGWNKITLEFLGKEDNKNESKITSKPFLPSTLLDYGENLAIIKT